MYKNLNKIFKTRILNKKRNLENIHFVEPHDVQTEVNDVTKDFICHPAVHKHAYIF